MNIIFKRYFFFVEKEENDDIIACLNYKNDNDKIY